MLNHFVYSFIGIFVAMDIVGVLPVALGMTRGLPPERESRVINQSMLVAFVVASFFLLLGDVVFKLFGFTAADFKIGGGTVILVMSILELVTNRKPEDAPHQTGVVPLGVPLITGPALITIAMLQASLYGPGVVLVTLSLNFLIAWVVLRKGSLVTSVIGIEGTGIFAKIMALFTTAIAFSMIRSGIFDAMREAGLLSGAGR